MCLVSEVRSQTNTNRNTHIEDLRNIKEEEKDKGRGWTNNGHDDEDKTPFAVVFQTVQTEWGSD